MLRRPFSRAMPWKPIILGVVACVAVGLLYQRIDLDTVHDYAERLNGPMVFVLLTLLPLAGFPVTVLYVVVGVRFGAAWGMALVAAATLLQLLASYGLVHLFRDKFARRLAAVRKRIPRTAHGAACLFTTLLPGVPFFAKNYVLPLIGVPLRTYLLVCFPVYVARATVAVVFGDQSDHITPARIAWLAL